jgi:hypothetical protein
MRPSLLRHQHLEFAAPRLATLSLAPRNLRPITLATALLVAGQTVSRPSTPAAPLLARTRLSARCRFSLVSATCSSPDPVPSGTHRGLQASSLARASNALPVASTWPRTRLLLRPFAVLCGLVGPLQLLRLTASLQGPDPHSVTLMQSRFASFVVTDSRRALHPNPAQERTQSRPATPAPQACGGPSRPHARPAGALLPEPQTQKASTCVLAFLVWCPGEDSNLHGVTR